MRGERRSEGGGGGGGVAESVNSRELTGKDRGSRSATFLLRPTLAFCPIDYCIPGDNINLNDMT